MALAMGASLRAQEQAVKNIIFMIGDGMGLTHTQLAMMSSQAPLAVERVQYIGLAKTYSANNRVTDSAAGGTALATGVKTNNGSVGVDPEGKTVKNITEYTREKGLATGVVVTKDITDATPAAFMAHQQSRKMAPEIAVDISECGVDLFIGGGRNNFEKRKDGVNLTDNLKGKGYHIAYTIEDVKSVDKGKLAGMLATKHMKTMKDGRGDVLPQATAQALTILKNNSPKGFFLMVEGSMIDTGGHANDAEYVLGETLDFWQAVTVAFDFADKNPGTLVVITADHETGGLTFPSDNEDFLLGDAGVEQAFSTKGHTASMVPVYSYGAGAKNFSTVMDNTDIPKKMLELLKIKPVK